MQLVRGLLECIQKLVSEALALKQRMQSILLKKPLPDIFSGQSVYLNDIFSEQSVYLISIGTCAETEDATPVGLNPQGLSLPSQRHLRWIRGCNINLTLRLRNYTKTVV